MRFRTFDSLRRSAGRTLTVSFRGIQAALFFQAALLSAGCADLHYQRLQLGQAPQEYERVLPAEQTQRGDLGLCYFEEDATGRGDAIVVLLGEDRRVAGKLQATRFERKYGFKTDTGFLLRGEVNPKALGLEPLGPLDTLRAVLNSLLEHRNPSQTPDSHKRVAGGLARLLQHWPQSGGETQPAPEGLEEILTQIPAGGAASIQTDARGFYLFEYRQGVTR